LGYRQAIALPEPSPLRSSPLALTVLFMLIGEPLHPYEMQRRIKLWGKDQVVNVAQRANLYKTIDRLHQAGLIAVRLTERDQRFPERTVYELTEAGFRVGREWLIDMLSTPRNEFPRFPAALSFIMTLAPNEAAEVLERRAVALRETLAELERVLSGADGPLPPRITLIETEYLRAMTQAEVDWLCSVIDELRSGTLSWSYEELAEAAKRFLQ
jgi:DNA-binding PadR family transcriptional regulator